MAACSARANEKPQTLGAGGDQPNARCSASAIPDPSARLIPSPTSGGQTHSRSPIRPISCRVRKLNPAMAAWGLILSAIRARNGWDCKIARGAASCSDTKEIPSLPSSTVDIPQYPPATGSIRRSPVSNPPGMSTGSIWPFHPCQGFPFPGWEGRPRASTNTSPDVTESVQVEPSRSSPPSSRKRRASAESIVSRLNPRADGDRGNSAATPGDNSNRARVMGWGFAVKCSGTPKRCRRAHPAGDRNSPHTLRSG